MCFLAHYPSSLDPRWICKEQSGFTNLFKFATGYLDSSTGLYKFGTRYYDPTLGRWTQLDSAGTGYTYAGDDPVNAVDPSGHIAVVVAALVLLAIGAVVGAIANCIPLAFTNPNPSARDIGQCLFVGALVGLATTLAGLLFMNPIALTVDNVGGIFVT
ncbi:MAG: RHS repeat-associated core domain-containing protein, partial [Ktedonobacteraceae bacterium]